jgi:2-oxoglutarate dehydrogenase E2 component (dihydrolipoamide succinyltransferase)
VSEEDTVTVGQDLIKLELGGAPEGKKDEGAEKPKESEPKKESPKPQGAAEAKPALGNREERRVCFCHVSPHCAHRHC